MLQLVGKKMPIRNFHKDGSKAEHGQVFVFGSNLAGIHGAGAAKAALGYGAVMGIGRGRIYNSYAIPTKDEDMETLPLRIIKIAVAEFLVHAAATFPDQFFVTRIGCGLAGYRNEDIAPMFLGAPINCSFADEWKPWLGEK